MDSGNSGGGNESQETDWSLDEGEMEATDYAKENPEMAPYHEMFKCCTKSDISSHYVSRSEAGRGARRTTTEVDLGGGQTRSPANSEDSALRETADGDSTAWQARLDNEITRIIYLTNMG